MSDWNTESAEWYAEKYGEYATNRLAVDRLELPADSAILDIGCGTGAALRHAVALGARGTLVGVDAVPRMVEIAEERSDGSPLRFLLGAAEALPVGDSSFDVVLAFDSYDHWEDPSRGLAEVRRVLRPGGRFIVVKDGGVPARRSFSAEVCAAGFCVESEELIEEEEVTFILWQCRISGADMADMDPSDASSS